MEGRVEEDVLSTPGHLISLAERGFARLSEARLKPLGFGVGHLPVLVALQDGQVGSQRDLARFARIEQPSMAQMLARIKEENLPVEAYNWYLDLRKYGTFVHSGFGLGLERTVGWICGIHHIREAIAFPRTMNRLRP